MAISSVAMLIATVAYVYINSKMHKEMIFSRQRDESPEIALKLLRIQSGFYDLQIINQSSNPLFNLKFSKYPDSTIARIEKDKNLGILKEGISYMAPYQEYSSFFLNYPAVVEKFGKSTLPILEFAFSFNDQNGRSYERNIKIELSSLYNLTMLGAGADIHVHLTKITDLMEKYFGKR